MFASNCKIRSSSKCRNDLAFVVYYTCISQVADVFAFQQSTGFYI